MYAQKVEGDSWKGERLDKGKIDKMSGKGSLGPSVVRYAANRVWIDQQLGQMYELMQAIKKQGQDDGEGIV